MLSLLTSGLLLVSHQLKTPVARCRGSLDTEVCRVQWYEGAGRGSDGAANGPRTGTDGFRPSCPSPWLSHQCSEAFPDLPVENYFFVLLHKLPTFFPGLIFLLCIDHLQIYYIIYYPSLPFPTPTAPLSCNVSFVRAGTVYVCVGTCARTRVCVRGRERGRERVLFNEQHLAHAVVEWTTAVSS